MGVGGFPAVRVVLRGLVGIDLRFLSLFKGVVYRLAYLRALHFYGLTFFKLSMQGFAA